MLVNNNVNPAGKVVAIKLTTGEEIIARCMSDANHDSIIVKRPLSLVLASMPDSEEQGMIVFTPWMLGIEDDTQVKLMKSSIIFMAPARKDAETQYIEATGDVEHPAPRGVMNNTVARGRR